MSKIIKILGSGCPKCKITVALVEEVVKENNIDANIIKVEDIMEIMEYNVLSTPAIVIDEKITIKGRVPSKNEVLNLLISNPVNSDNNSEGCCAKDNCC